MLHRKSFFMCPKCQFIDSYPAKIQEKNGRLEVDNGFSCKQCGHKYDGKTFSQTEGFLLWPRFDVIEFIQDDVLEALFLKAEPFYKDYELKLKLVLYCTVTDFLLDDFLDSLLSKNGSCENADDITSFTQKDALFKRMTGDSLKNAFDSGGYAAFAEKALTFKRLRNKFIHDSFDVDVQKVEETIQIIEEQALNAFRYLHNKYIVSSGLSSSTGKEKYAQEKEN